MNMLVMKRWDIDAEMMWQLLDGTEETKYQVRMPGKGRIEKSLRQWARTASRRLEFEIYFLMEEARVQ